MLSQGGQAGLSLKVLLQAVMDPRQFGLTPGSIRCAGNQIQEEMCRSTQTWGNGHISEDYRLLPTEHHLGEGGS